MNNVDYSLMDKVAKNLDKKRGGSHDDGEPPDNDMEARVIKLESDLTAIKIDVAVIKANGATRADIAELKGAAKSDISDAKATLSSSISEAKTTIIMWVVSAIFLAQLLPTLLKKFGM